MRKTHLRVVIDEALNAEQTACGLRITEERPLAEYAEDLTCEVCKKVAEDYLKDEEEKAEKRKAKKRAKKEEANAEKA